MAIMYDLFLLAALWFIVSAIATALNHGEAIGPDNPYHLIFVFSLLLISFFYYGWFWTHGGQTLGMKTWKIKLTTLDGRVVDWKQALVYFLAAMLSWAVCGLGFLWSVFEPRRATWHDLVAGCMMQDIR